MTADVAEDCCSTEAHSSCCDSWDPFFADSMSLLDVYHYGTVHFEYHQRQLTFR